MFAAFGIAHQVSISALWRIASTSATRWLAAAFPTPCRSIILTASAESLGSTKFSYGWSSPRDNLSPLVAQARKAESGKGKVIRRSRAEYGGIVVPGTCEFFDAVEAAIFASDSGQHEIFARTIDTYLQQPGEFLIKSRPESLPQTPKTLMLVFGVTWRPLLPAT
jgi:hypothetical protein